MNEIEQWWNATVGVKLKYLEKTQSQCHRQPHLAFVSCKASFVCYVCVPCTGVLISP